MATPNDIQPGLIDPLTMMALQGIQSTLDDNRNQIEQLEQDNNLDFPAKITAATYDSTLGVWVCSWTEQTYDPSGLRVDLPSGRFGTATSSPAIPTGNGEMPPVAFPVEVRLTMRSFSATLGPLYEFPWSCSCVQIGGSGSGGSSTVIGITTTCCPSNSIPSTFYGHLHNSDSPCGDCASGVSMTFTWNGTNWTSGNVTLGTSVVSFTVSCNVSLWSLTYTNVVGGTCNVAGASPFGVGFVTCDPFYLEFTHLRVSGCVAGSLALVCVG